MIFQTDILGNLLEELIDYRGKTPVKTSLGIPLVTAKIIKNGVINEFTEFIAESDYDRWMVRGFPKSGDVVLTTEAPLGEVAQLDDRKIALAQRVVCLRGKSNLLDNTYLKYYFLSQYGKKSLKSRESGTTVTGIKQSELKNVEVRYPSFQDQCNIASVLSSLDDKIAVNKKICENLEAQAQALFKHWFVDFAPFKDGKFVESELGLIPEGWRVGTLGDICVTNKRTYGSSSLGIIEYIDTGSVTNNKIDNIQILDPKIDKIPSRARRAITEGDILFSSVRPNQRHFAFMYNPNSRMVASTGFVVITANWSGYRYYIYQYLIQDSVINYLQAIAEQSVSTYPSINASDITNIKVIIPPDDIIRDYASILSRFMGEIDRNNQESSRLSTLRDTLLPKLMSGQIKV